VASYHRFRIDPRQGERTNERQTIPFSSAIRQTVTVTRIEITTWKEIGIEGEPEEKQTNGRRRTAGNDSGTGQRPRQGPTKSNML
jgi:hypothetical protein